MVKQLQAGLLTYSPFTGLPAPSTQGSGESWQRFTELTAAGTVADLHGIPSSFQNFGNL